MIKISPLLLFACLIGITSCGTSTPEKTSTSDNSISSSETTLTSKSLIIYFSATNHTKNVAETIANHLASPIYELEPVNPYISGDLNYSNENSRVVKEYLITQRGERVDVELTNTSFAEFAETSYIFLGAPVWWQQLSWVIENFVSENDFSNKTIIPFGTSASSSFNLNNLTPLTEDDNNVTWLNPQRFSSDVSSSVVTSWVDSLNLNIR